MNKDYSNKESNKVNNHDICNSCFFQSNSCYCPNKHYISNYKTIEQVLNNIEIRNHITNYLTNYQRKSSIDQLSEDIAFEIITNCFEYYFIKLELNLFDFEIKYGLFEIVSFIKFSIENNQFFNIQSKSLISSIISIDHKKHYKYPNIIKQLKNNDKEYQYNTNIDEMFNQESSKMLKFIEGLNVDQSFKKYLLKEDFIQSKRKLIIYTMKFNLLNNLINNDKNVILISCDTGTGKTTQLVQYLNNFKTLITNSNNHKPIFCSQPRKISVIKGSERVFEENKSLKVERLLFEENSNHYINGDICFLTEYSLLKLLIQDPLFSIGNILFLDEAHERTIIVDMILLILKTHTLIKRKDFKLIITSATINFSKFIDYFKSFDPITFELSFFKNTQIVYEYKEGVDYNNYIDKTIETIKLKVIEIYQLYHNTINDRRIYNSILVFLPSADEINYIDKEIKYIFSDYINSGELSLFKLFGSMEYSQQTHILNFEGNKGVNIKIILSTNVSETSLTIKHLDYVIDSGYHKIRRYNYKTKSFDDKIESISQDSAIQRAGRTGRIKQGTCIRIYSPRQFNDFNKYRDPEIKRTNISFIILKIIFYGIKQLDNIDLIDQPSDS